MRDPQGVPEFVTKSADPPVDSGLPSTYPEAGCDQSVEVGRGEDGQARCGGSYSGSGTGLRTSLPHDLQRCGIPDIDVDDGNEFRPVVPHGGAVLYALEGVEPCVLQVERFRLAHVAWFGFGVVDREGRTAQLFCIPPLQELDRSADTVAVLLIELAIGRDCVQDPDREAGRGRRLVVVAGKERGARRSAGSHGESAQPRDKARVVGDAKLARDAGIQEMQALEAGQVDQFGRDRSDELVRTKIQFAETSERAERGRDRSRETVLVEFQRFEVLQGADERREPTLEAVPRESQPRQPGHRGQP